MKKLFILLTAVVSFTACEKEIDEITISEVNAPEYAGKGGGNIQIAEGQGVGKIVVLGMTRDEIRSVATNGNCDTANECTFRLNSKTAAITVTFDASDLVSRITINQNGLLDRDKWITSYGADENMKPSEVRDLYPGSVMTISSPYVYVDASQYGYYYTRRYDCVYGDCIARTIHTILPVESETVGGQNEFKGDIILNNPSHKSSTYTINLEITNPVGEVNVVPPFSESIPGGGSVSISPGNFVDVNGTTGTYKYKAVLLKRKGRTESEVGVSIGVFEIVSN